MGENIVLVTEREDGSRESQRRQFQDSGDKTVLESRREDISRTQKTRAVLEIEGAPEYRGGDGSETPSRSEH